MNRSIFGFVATALLTMTAYAGFTAEVTHVPATAHAAASADLITRANRALRDYLAACSSGDDEAIARNVTSDAVVEYALEEPGTYLTVEAAELSAKRTGGAEQIGPAVRISALWIFPTNEPNTVFIRYTTSSGVRSPGELPDSEHLAVLEMRGDRIVKLRNFSADAGTLPTLDASVVARATASSRVNAHE
jgi:hypothetical protein